MRQSFRIVSILLILVPFLQSCASGFSPASILSTRNPWISNWLQKPTCRPPCWEHITPGTTTIEEALTILKGLQNVSGLYYGNDAIDWDLDSTDAGRVISLNAENVTTEIILSINGNQKLPLSEVVKSYGFPSFVRLYDCRGENCIIHLIYPDSGIVLDLFLQNIGSDSFQTKITPNSNITKIIFFSPGMQSYQAIPEFSGGEMLEWKGYSTYPQ